MKKYNQGFTIVEMIVSVCILSIISVMLITFISSGTMNYKRTGDNVNLQKESQMAMNQITELLMDATNGVTYSVNDVIVDSDDNFVATGAGVTEKSVSVYNRIEPVNNKERFIRADIVWQDSSNTLVYSETLIEEDDKGKLITQPIPLESGTVFAEHVESFEVDLSKVDKNNSVIVKLGFSVSNQKFNAKKTITLRNHVKVNGDIDGDFKEVALPATVDDVILNPSMVYVEQGSTYGGFQTTIVGKNAPRPDIEWKIINKDELTDVSGTSIGANGTIQIGTKETCKVIKVKATSVVSKELAGDDESQYVYAVADVYNKYIVEGNPITITDVKTEANLTATATVNINGVNFEGNENYSHLVVFEVYDGDVKLSEEEVSIQPLEKVNSASVNDVSSYKLTVVGTEKYLNKPLTLKAVVTDKGSTQTEIEFKKATLKEISIVALNDNGTIGEKLVSRESKRGETFAIGLETIYGYEDNSSQDEVRYITPDDSEWKRITWSTSGGKISFADGIIAISADSSVFPYDSSFSHINVTAAYGDKNTSMNITIPKVSLQILGKHEDDQKAVGIVANRYGAYPAAIKFNIRGIVFDENIIKLSSSIPDGFVVKQSTTDNEYVVYATKTASASLTFKVNGMDGVEDTINIVAYNANIKDSNGKTLPYFVPASNSAGTFFSETKWVYYDLYGNRFEYVPNEPLHMKFNNITYQYSNKKSDKAWKPVN